MNTNLIARSGWCSNEHDKTMLRYAANITEKETPSILFLNTASSSSPQYHDNSKNTIESIGCIYSTFDFFGSIRIDYRDYILSHDIIYVGGGNTRSLLALWKEYGIDKVIREAWERGTVLTGFSAGAICWFEECLTDSLAGDPQVLKGLGFIKGSACPHYDVEESRRPTYLRRVSAGEIMPGYGLNDLTSLHFKDGVLYKILTTQDGVVPIFIDKDGTEARLEAEVVPYIQSISNPLPQNNPQIG